MGQKGYDPFYKEEVDHEEDLSDKEIDSIVKAVTDDDIVNHAYEDDEFVIVDDETGEHLHEEVELVNEVLSRIERMKAKARFARTKSKRERKTAIALKRYSSTSVINSRARKLAIKVLKQKMAKGRNLNKLSVGEKERLEKMIQKRKKVIDRIALQSAEIL